MNCYYNYAYLDPTKPIITKIPGIDLIFNFQPFYIGKGKNKRKYLSSKINKTNKHLSNKIKKLIRLGTPPIIIQFNKNLSEFVSLENEKYVVKMLGLKRDGGILLNLTYAGKGISGYKHSEKTKKKISNKTKGRVMSNEVKYKISLTVSKNHHMLGKKMTDEHKEKLHSSTRDKKQSIEHIEKCAASTCKPVKQIDIITGETIRIFKSLKEAHYETKISRISDVCKKKKKQAGGYYWEFAENKHK